jgi:alpha-1,3/alpha-1,6-mannosyltransferase
MGDWTLHENIGLRGQTAVWAKENLEDDRFEASSVSKFVERISTSQDETAAYKANIPTCTHLIEAIGFSRDPLPTLETDGKELKVECDHTTGGFKDKNGEKVNGLYGIGIAWPERVIDPYGNIEYAVGMWKFMTYLKRIVRGWYST